MLMPLRPCGNCLKPFCTACKSPPPSLPRIPRNLARASLCDALPSYQLLIPSSRESYASPGRCVCLQQDILSFLIVEIALKEEKQMVDMLTELSTVIDHIDVAGMGGNSWSHCQKHHRAAQRDEPS